MTSLNSIAVAATTGGITAPRGFRASGIACGIKANGRPDLSLIAANRPGIFGIAHPNSTAVERRIGDRFHGCNPFLTATV